MGQYVVTGRRNRRMPSAKLARAARRLADHYARLQDEIQQNPWAQAIVTHDKLPGLQLAIRSAALRLTVASLARDSLQRAAMWSSFPIAILLASAVPFIVTGPALSGIGYTAAAAATGAVIGVVTLLAAAVWGRAVLHFTLMMTLAVLGIAIEFPPTAVTPTAAHAFTAFCVTPAAMYAAFLPMIVVAYGCAWRLTRTIDPRARLVIGLLRCTHQMSRDTKWLHDSHARDQMAVRLEQVARIAERDLPRLLARRAQDTDTRAWLRENAQLIGTRIRECKRSLLLPDPRSRETVPSELLRLLLYATASEWNAMCAQQPPSESGGLLRRYAPHAAAGLVLIAAGLALPELLPVLQGVAGTNLRTVLLLSGTVALVPLDGSTLNRIPDAFANTVKPN